MRKLNKNEIEVKVKQVTQKGCLLLLYKTARVDMQKIVNADFRRLRNGEPPITEVNHLKTRGKI